MGRYLLVLDTDLLALAEKLDQEPINYLVERQEQQQCEVVVLSLVDTGQAKLSSLELLLGGSTSHGIYAPAKFPAARLVAAAGQQFLDLRFTGHAFPERLGEIISRTTAATPLFVVSFVAALVYQRFVLRRDTEGALTRRVG